MCLENIWVAGLTKNKKPERHTYGTPGSISRIEPGSI
jgi:hypothetical protein